MKESKMIPSPGPYDNLIHLDKRRGIIGVTVDFNILGINQSFNLYTGPENIVCWMVENHSEYRLEFWGIKKGETQSNLISFVDGRCAYLAQEEFASVSIRPHETNKEINGILRVSIMKIMN